MFRLRGAFSYEKKPTTVLFLALCGENASLGFIWCGALITQELGPRHRGFLMPTGERGQVLLVSKAVSVMEAALGGTSRKAFLHAWLCLRCYRHKGLYRDRL